MTLPVAQRFGMIARLRSDRRVEYLDLHRKVWPEVEAMISKTKIRNFTIFALGEVIVGYFEYTGVDYKADQAIMAADPATQHWWTLTGACQLPFEDGSDSPNWQPMDEVWHLA